MIKYLIFSVLIVFASCKGYHLKSNSNPLSKYGIRSVTVPMFVNHSILPNVQGALTKEIMFTLYKFSDLTVYSGENKKADAILLGIISSDNHQKSLFQTTANKYTDSDLNKAISGRSNFYVPTKTSFGLTVRFVLIKNPTYEEIALLKSNLAKQIPAAANSKIIFNEEITSKTSFSRVVSSTETGKEVNFTRNKALVERGVETIAQNVAKNFEDVLLYAF